MSGIEDALAYVDKAAVASLAADMIDIPSPVGSEGHLAEYLAARFRAVGLRVQLQEVEPNRFNVLGLLEGTGGGPTLMYAGHLDSAYAGDEEGISELGPGYQPKAWTEDDWIFGLGAFNMKSGHAASILAVEALARAKVRLRGDLIIGGVVGETCHAQVGRYQGSRYRGCGIGARYLIANGIRADAVVIPEPTGNKISVASGGYVYFELKTRAFPGSTFRNSGAINRPNSGKDAIGKMLATIPKLEEWGSRYLEKTRYRGEQAGNVNIIAIEGGHPFRPTKMACACRLYFEVGMMPGQVHGDIIAGLKHCADELRCDDPEMDLEIKVVQAAAPAEVSADEAVVRSTAAAHEAVWGQAPEVTWNGWYADTAPLTNAGIPSICYGPQGRARSGASGIYPSDGEQAHLVDLTKGAQVFVRAAYDFCMKERAAFRFGAVS
jgi:acetylornithine deacetylase/succinyl-diaminopimelate desuccinylase-like protein